MVVKTKNVEWLGLRQLRGLTGQAWLQSLMVVARFRHPQGDRLMEELGQLASKEFPSSRQEKSHWMEVGARPRRIGGAGLCRLPTLLDREDSSHRMVQDLARWGHTPLPLGVSGQP